MRFVRSIFVPEDDTCFHLYQANSLDDVRAVARRAALAYSAVVREVEVTNEPHPARSDVGEGSQ